MITKTLLFACLSFIASVTLQANGVVAPRDTSTCYATNFCDIQNFMQPGETVIYTLARLYKTHVLVVFFMEPFEDCGPCGEQMPALLQAAKNFNNVLFIAVDCVAYCDQIQEFHLNGYPTLWPFGIGGRTIPVNAGVLTFPQIAQLIQAVS